MVAMQKQIPHHAAHQGEPLASGRLPESLQQLRWYIGDQHGSRP